MDLYGCRNLARGKKQANGLFIKFFGTTCHLSISQRRGLITLIPKKNKPQQFLKDWRPINLLNCGYKIAGKAVATKMKRVLPDIIKNDQRGFLKGRSIGENVRLLNSVINYAE